MKKYIIYAGNFAEPDINAAGKRVFGNALILESLGYEVILIGKGKKSNSSERVQITDNISFVSFATSSLLNYKGYVNEIDHIISECKQKPCCIIRYGSPSLALFDYRLLKYCKKRRIPVVADVVDWLSADSGNLIFNLCKTLDTYLEKAVFNSKSDGIIAISTYLANYYKGVENKTIIPPVVEQFTQNTSKNDITQIVYAGSPFRLGVKVANTRKIKDRLDLTVKALGIIAQTERINFEYHIYGITKEQYLTAFPNDKKYTDTDKIVFHGRCPMKEVQEAISKADYSILLREKNRITAAGFPTKVVESISCGTPMITTDTSDLKKYIKHGKNGFIISIDSLTTLTNELVNILENDYKTKAILKKNCFEEKAFLPSCYKEQMDGFLSNLISA